MIDGGWYADDARRRKGSLKDGRALRFTGSDRVCFLLTIQEAAERLAVSRTTLYKLIRRGDIHAVKFGRSRRVTDTEIEDFIRSQVAKGMQTRG